MSADFQLNRRKQERGGPETLHVGLGARGRGVLAQGAIDVPVSIHDGVVGPSYDDPQGVRLPTHSLALLEHHFVFLLSNFLSHLPAQFSHSSTLRLLTGDAKRQDRVHFLSSSRTVKLSRVHTLLRSRNVSRSKFTPCLLGVSAD